MNVKVELAPLVNVAVVVVAVSYGVMHTLASLLGLAGLVIRGLLWLSAWRYAYSVLRFVAQGHHDLPTPGVEAVNPFADFRLVVHFLVLPVLIGVLVTLVSWPLPIRFALAVLVAASIPASAALMAMTDNFAIAMSPWHIAQLVERLGAGYAKLLASCAGVGLGLWVVRALPWPPLLAGIVANTFDFWAVLGVFVLTGALIREHRAEFGIPGEVEPLEERRERERRRHWQQVLDRAYASLRSGLLAKGNETIDELVASEGRSLLIYEWLFDSMMRWESKAHALELAKAYVDRLLEAGELHDALDLFARCRRISEQFAIAPASARLLADYARSIGRIALAEDLDAMSNPG